MARIDRPSCRAGSVHRDVSSLAEAILEPCASAPIIGIDGCPGAGKTCLARSLAQVLKVPFVSTDCYLHENVRESHYWDKIKLDSLGASVCRSVRANGRVILEGVFLLEILDRLQVASGSFCIVYVKCISRNSHLWHFGDELNSCPWTTHALWRSVLQYHTCREPHLLADFIFERIEEGLSSHGCHA